MQDMKVALFTIEDLKKNHPDYYRRLNPKCQVCQNILSSSECDMREEFDMFARVKGGNEVRQAEFAELSREVMPVLDKLTEIAGQHGTAEKLVSITLSAEGYIHFTVHDSGMCLSRLKREDAPELEIRKQLSQEMGREEN